MEDIHMKEIPLGHVTVKVPGMRPRGSRSTSTNQDPTNNGNIAMEMNNLSIGGKIEKMQLMIIVTARPLVKPPSIHPLSQRKLCCKV